MRNVYLIKNLITGAVLSVCFTPDGAERTIDTLQLQRSRFMPELELGIEVVPMDEFVYEFRMHLRDINAENPHITPYLRRA